MTFQQLEYIVAVDKARHFQKAATQFGVNQSSLSATIQKLEQEIDIVIFDRTKHPIEPTPMGQRIIRQAEVILHNSAQLRDMADNEHEDEKGELQLGMAPSVAPVLFPRFGRVMAEGAPNLDIHVHEHGSSRLIDALLRSELDLAIMDAADVRQANLPAVELWTEHFMLYASDAHPLCRRDAIRPEEMLDGNIWTLRSFHDHYPQLADVTHQASLRRTTLESGSLQTLITAVDLNGGFTLLPESFAACLSAEQVKRMHRITSGRYLRTMALGVRRDYVRQRMLGLVAGAVSRIIPRQLLLPGIADNAGRIKI